MSVRVLAPFAIEELRYLPPWVNRSKFLQSVMGTDQPVTPVPSQARLISMHTRILEDSERVKYAVRAILEVEIN